MNKVPVLINNITHIAFLSVQGHEQRHVYFHSRDLLLLKDS